MSKHSYLGILLFFLFLSSLGGLDRYLDTAYAQWYDRELNSKADKERREFDSVMDRLSRDAADRAGRAESPPGYGRVFEKDWVVTADNEEYGELTLTAPTTGIAVPPIPPSNRTWCLTPVGRCPMRQYALSGLSCRCGAAKGATVN